MTKDSEMTLSFIADAYGRCLGLFVLLLLAPALLTFVGGKLLRRRSMHYKPPWMCPAWASESVYPAVISYLWFYYIPTRSIPK